MTFRMSLGFFFKSRASFWIFCRPKKKSATDQALSTKTILIDIGILRYSVESQCFRSEPTSGATFTILDATSLTGTFGTSNLPSLSSNLSWSTSYNPSAGTVILSITSVLPIELLAFKADPSV
jgi:hypothetical protein